MRESRNLRTFQNPLAGEKNLLRSLEICFQERLNLYNKIELLCDQNPLISLLLLSFFSVVLIVDGKARVIVADKSVYIVAYDCY